jgi:rod shape determining protein RodA
MLSWHVAIDIGMVTELLPVVGMTLPFISDGGSSVLTVTIALGVAMSVSIRRYAF